MLVAVAVLILSGRSLVAGLFAVFLLIFGFALCVPLAVRTASALLAAPAARIGGMLARMAVAGIGESLSRTGVAIVALAVAVSATIGEGSVSRASSSRRKDTDRRENTQLAAHARSQASGP